MMFFPLYKVLGSPKRVGGGGGVLTPRDPWRCRRFCPDIVFLHPVWLLDVCYIDTKKETNYDRCNDTSAMSIS